jgi:hypothetical protein
VSLNVRKIVERIRIQQDQVGTLAHGDHAEIVLALEVPPDVRVPDLMMWYGVMPASVIRFIAR